ncbi:MAG: 2-C-methyl-D-erythritol 2,4-cyclodiphosphate synthase [Actinobacteria bacterium]|uniref:2-C-methyl-D-erythritol 2,4-cyclodiphosphate synthase n=1 Tax=freshwater metagenome TaxID=449393 RepID=A0A6J5ZUP8_9ZZZZ|nr:2-C-methyl-D-erythritol 2,4-cyclodiphosphate synthase [Actinomycetota bacterium]
MSETRTGLGVDSHRLVEGRPLILGGVEFESPLGLDGHSDADVLTHAVIDALLGAGGMGDIGAHFPDTDERWQGADSIELLSKVAGMLIGGGFEVVNIDATVIIEEPKIGPKRDQIRERIAGALGVEASAVNVKATTAERIGAFGRGEGAAAMAVATLRR